jgi:hypothetical protein
MKTNQDWRQWAHDKGIETTEDGLVLPDHDQSKLDAKIARDLPEVAAKITVARADGRDVIYLPGSYDLVHLGHLSYVEQAAEHYLVEARAQGRAVTREDLYIVMLADDDHLLRHVKAHKHVEHGGDETFTRPIEVMPDGHDRSPRLDALATLPVDCVGFIPSPAQSGLPTPLALDLEACRKIVEPKDHDEYDEILAAYEQIESWLGHEHNLATNPARVAAWQLYINLQMVGAVKIDLSPVAASGDCVTRVVSLHDGRYLDIVVMISRWSGIATTIIEDVEVISTSALLKQFGPERLLERKAEAISLRLQ